MQWLDQHRIAGFTADLRTNFTVYVNDYVT